MKSQKSDKKQHKLQGGIAAPRNTFLPLNIIYAVLIVLFGVILYSNTLKNPFVFDDLTYVINNPALKAYQYYTDSSLVERAIAWNRIDANFRTRTVGFFSLFLNYKLGGFNVLGYHLFNMGIHVCNGLIVYWLVLLTLRTPFFRYAFHQQSSRVPVGLSAFFAALLFVSHPVQTQAVTYIAQRFTCLAVLFCLLSLAMYAQWRLSNTAQQEASAASDKISVPAWRYFAPYAVSFLSAVMAMKTKEISFTLPILIAMYEFMFFEGERKKRILYILPLLLTMLIIPLTIVTDVVTRSDIARLGDSIKGDGAHNQALTYLYTQFPVVVTYLRLIVFPVRQNVDYDYHAFAGFFSPQVVLSFLFLLGIFCMAVFLYVRSRSESVSNRAWIRLSAFGVFWFFITLSVESSVIPLEDFIFEHRLYLPLAGVVLSAVSAGNIIRSRIDESKAKWLITIPLAVVALCAITAYSRNGIWSDPVRFWADNVVKSPGKPRPHLNLGIVYMGLGRYPDAMREIEEALKLDSKYLRAYQYLGYVYFQQQNYEKALDVLKGALRIDSPAKDIPEIAEIHNNMGIVYNQMNRLSEAEKEFLTAIELRKDLAEAYTSLGSLYLMQNRTDDALRVFVDAVTIDPFSDVVHFNLGNVYSRQMQFQFALREYQTALKINPANIQAQQRFDDLIRTEGKNLNNRPAGSFDFRPVQKENQLGLTLRPATTQAGTAPIPQSNSGGARVVSDMAEFYFNLGVEYEAKRDFSQAKRAYEKVMVLNPAHAVARGRLDKINKREK